MAIISPCVNHKGRVDKTMTVFTLGFCLADLGQGSRH